MRLLVLALLLTSDVRVEGDGTAEGRGKCAQARAAAHADALAKCRKRGYSRAEEIVAPVREGYLSACYGSDPLTVYWAEFRCK